MPTTLSARIATLSYGDTIDDLTAAIRNLGTSPTPTSFHPHSPGASILARVLCERRGEIWTATTFPAYRGPVTTRARRVR